MEQPGTANITQHQKLYINSQRSLYEGVKKIQHKGTSLNTYLAYYCDLKNIKSEIFKNFSLRIRFSSTGLRETAPWLPSPCPPSCGTASLTTARTPPCPGLPSSSLGSRCSSQYRVNSFFSVRKRHHLRQRVNNLTTRAVVLSERPDGADPQHLRRVGQRDQRQLADPRPRRRRQNRAPPPDAQHSRI